MLLFSRFASHKEVAGRADSAFFPPDLRSEALLSR